MDLILWRHAEAADGTPDDARELTAKGVRQAGKAAAFLHQHLPGDARILVSPAIRTQQTARAFTKRFTLVPAIAPGASAQAVLQAADWPDGEGTVLVVGHQPTLGEVAAQLLDCNDYSLNIRKGALWWFSRRERGGWYRSRCAWLSRRIFCEDCCSTWEGIMFESAELGHKIDKETYDREVPLLREALLEAQIDLAKLAKFPVIILVGGVDGAGRGETVNLLNEWMDPRFIQTHGMGEPSDEELDRPMMWRFWRELPPKGRIGVFLGSWYTWPIINRVAGRTKTADLDQSLERAKRLETMLADEGALILKFWMHLSKEKQAKRLKLLEKDPKTRWRVTERDWEHYKLYDKYRVVSESVIRHTSTAEAPWTIVEGYDPRYRSLTVGKTILEAVRKRIDEAGKKGVEISAPPPLPNRSSVVPSGSVPSSSTIVTVLARMSFFVCSYRTPPITRSVSLSQRCSVTCPPGI